MSAVDKYEPDRPPHEVELRLLAQPEVVEISAEVELEIGHPEMLRMLADYLDGDGGALLMLSMNWSAEEDKWILTATIDH